MSLVVAIWAVTATCASAQQEKTAGQPINFVEMFLQLDANNDTVIDLDEVPESGRAAYKRLLELGDTDKNGRLELAELRALGEKARRSGLFPNLTPQQRFQMLDKNGDGKVTRDEFPGNPDVFDRIDSDKDGLLSISEVTQAPPGAGGGMVPTLLRERLRAMDTDGDGKITRGEFQGPQAIFDRLDVNKDGVLNRDDNPAATTEPEKAQVKKKAAAAKNAPPQAGAGRFGPMFQAMDKDGDGKLSRAEFQGREANFDRLDLNKDGVLEPSELNRAVTKGAGQRFPAMDKDGDGKLSRTEFTGPPALFNRLDVNQDGFLSRAEAARFQAPGAAAKAKKKQP
jgi:Ca2+-binding EF-hand superfamily protein